MTRPQALVAVVAAVVITTEVLLAVLVNDRQWVAPTVLFWLVVVAASLCVAPAASLTWVAARNGQPELGFVALFFFAVSVLPVVHGLTTPGVLYASNTATAASVFWAVPVGMLALAPSPFRASRVGLAVARR